MMRIAILALLCLAAACITPARAADPLTPDQTKAVERLIHDYIVKHPEVLLEAIQTAEDREKADKIAKAEQSIRQRHDELYNDPDTQIGGNPKGDVTIVEFFDYRCPYCKQVQPLLESLIKSDPQLRVAYREFPILGPASTYASKMALASRIQGKYAAFHNAMMETKGNIDEKIIDTVAASVGIDIAKAKTDMAAPAVQAVIKKSFDLADAINVNGTPAFIIAGKLYPGAMTLEELKKLIADARAAHAG
jgi:protein-disulfide isomerase